MDVKVRTCKFCKRSCTEPKFLPCLHSFCKLCLKFQIIKVPTNHQWEGFSCPACGTYTKAIDPDKPLATWADQFPDSLTKRKPIRSHGSTEDSTDSTPGASPRTSTSVRFPSTGSGSPGPYSPASPGTQSPGPFSPKSPGNQSPGPFSPQSPGTKSPGPFSPQSPGTQSPGPFSPQSRGPISPQLPGPKSPGTFTSVPESPRNSDSMESSKHTDESTRNESESESKLVSLTSPGISTLGDFDPFGYDTSKSSLHDPNIRLEESLSELSVSSPDKVGLDDSVFSDSGNEKMCTIHLWKPIIVTCKSCNNIEACGQCLIETHTTCKGEAFVPIIAQKPLLPDISKLEREVQKVDQANDRITSSAYQLQQAREMIRQKIKLIALLLIQKMKKDEVQMVKTVEQVYHNEIWRLKSGINPSENLLKQVQDLKDRTEEVMKQHPAAVVHQSESLLEEHKDLLQRVKAVDYSCVPPEVTFVPNYDTLALTLGDLVVDDGYFPKHDVPPVAEKPQEVEVQRMQSLPSPTSPQPIPVVSPRTSQSEQGVSTTPPTPEATPVQASSSKRKGSDSTGKSKSKAKSIFDKIRSPKQKQSKFYTKFPEL